jgi:hypothetical protein
VFLLIDTRNPPPGPEPGPIRERPPWEPNWRLWCWVALTIALFVAADSTAGLVAYVLVLAAFFAACRAVLVILPSLDGLREYRQ